VPLWKAFEVAEGEELRIGRSTSGARCYLAVRGGIEVPLILGSASTHLVSGLGGLEGRALRRGDRLFVGPGPQGCGEASASPPRREPGLFRVTDGPQAGWFNAAEFYEATYKVTPEVNRMGIRLQGPPLTANCRSELISEGVAIGSIQVPAGGQPVILFVEQQTTGGYAKIANVIAADLPALGQLKPGDTIRFQRVDLREARELLYIQERWIRSI
jgi:antagonist of KipI